MARRRTLFALLGLSAALAVACSSSDDAAGPSDSLQRPVVETRFAAQWKPETVVVDGPAVQSSLLNPDADDRVYRFKPSPELAPKLEQGNVLLLTGVDLLRITRVEHAADAITVYGEPASLSDAAEDADGDWKITNALPLLEPVAPPTGVTAVESAATGLRPLTVGDITPGGRSAAFKGSMNGYTVEVKYTREANAFKAQGTFDYLDEATSGKLRVVTAAAVKALDVRGNVGVKKGATEAFGLDVDNIDMTFEIALGVVLTQPGLKNFIVPLQARIPFAMGPVPMYLGLGMELEIESAIGPQSSMFHRASCRVVGNGRVSFQDGKPTSTGHLPTVTCTAEPKDYLAPAGNFGFGLRADFPKLTLGVGRPKPTGVPVPKALDNAIEGFFAVKHEVIGNIEVYREVVGNFPVVAGTCFKLNVNHGLFVGGTFRIAGVGLGQEVQIAGGNSVHKQLGNGRLGCETK